ncbi:MAG: TonB-dependent receptor [Sulfuricella sp.]|jgi:vitamin B12 transporter|nr:TonB-dependent receptor [Sulfuricella sp.]
MKRNIKLGLVSLALVNGAGADQLPVYPLNDIVVTATRTPQPIQNMVADMSVISAEDIRAAGQSTLAELLQTQPGVEISSNGGPGAATSIYLRGANAGHTLVLVDGMRIGSATTGATALENIPLDQIERIEILRGPASHLYGSDAIGGVIQIFTRSGKGAPAANFSAGVGNFNTQTLSAGYGGEFGDNRFNFQVGHEETDGISSYAPGNPGYQNQNQDKDGYRNTNLSVKLARTLAAGHEIGVDGFASQGRSHYDGITYAPDFTPLYTTDFYRDQTLSAFDVYSKNHINDRWQSLLRFGTGSDHSNEYSDVKDVFNTDQNQFLWQNDIAVGPGTALLGVERVVQKVSGTTAYSVSSRTIQSWFAGYQAHAGKHSFQANLRNDDNSQFGSHDTGYLGYSYQLAPRWRVGAGLGSAFKAPNFNDLYWPDAGNPDLRPERSRNKEASLHYDGGIDHFSAVYFDNQVSDLIAWAPIAPNSWVWKPANVNQASLRGVSLSGSIAVGAYLLNANLTLQKPEDAATGKLLINRAEQHGSVKLSRDLGAWKLAGELVFSGERYSDAGNTLKMGGYGLVNVSAGYALDKEWSLQARVNNLFDRQYELAQGYGTPGVNVFMGVRYQPAR